MSGNRAGGLAWDISSTRGNRVDTCPREEDQAQEEGESFPQIICDLQILGNIFSAGHSRLRAFVYSAVELSAKFCQKCGV